jgi:chemotaxis protein MotB
MSSGLRPIIIKRKKAGHAAHHGGAWKVAFADFMTAMMAFFLVMWIIGLSESTRKAIAGYFKQPGIFSFTTGKAKPAKIEVAESQHAGDGSGANNTRASQDVVISQSACQPSNEPSAAETHKIEAVKSEIQERLAKLATEHPEMKKLVGSIDMTVTREGLRIELSETKDVVYFDVGGARPNKAARDVLAAIAPQLAELGNDIVVEGHTDKRPYPGTAYTNWELSADRANAARKLLVESGLNAKQLVSVTGYADMKLRNSDNAFDVSNRRVSIVVKFKEPPPAVHVPPAPPIK